MHQWTITIKGNFNYRHLCMFLIVAAFGVSFPGFSQNSPSKRDSAPSSKSEQISRLISTRCLECHASQMKGGLDLRTRESALEGGETGPALQPGNATKSLLIEQVYNEKMPPKQVLSDEEVELLEDWVTEGASYPETPLDPFTYTTDKRAGYDWWSIQPIRRPTPGTLAQNNEENPIDQFIETKLSQHGLDFSAPAPPRTLIRRATYNLIGLPPTPEEVAAFLDACEEETKAKGSIGDKAYEALIDRLLSSPHYGEKWGRHWLDVVRFGESTGFEVNHIVDNMWPYRDYVIQSFNEDKPYDQFVLEQLAGDSVGEGDVSVEVGMTFLVAGAHDIVGNQDAVQAAQIRANTVDEMIRATSESFMGLTVGCARCHDHKFDPIFQKDYYQYYATFGGVYHDNREVGTKEQKDVYREKSSPFRKEIEDLKKRKSEIQQTIIARAESKKDTYDANWPRPSVKRTGTEEIFEPVLARFLRITVEGRDNDPYSKTGFRMDEVEVWTDEALSRNVAAARNGGVAKGQNSKPGDFADAYGPGLTIDESFGASWIAAAPTLTLEFAKPEKVSRLFFSSDRPGALSETAHESTFIGEYRVEVSLNGTEWVPVADSYNRSPVNDKHRRKRYLDAETSDVERISLRDLVAEIRKVNGQLSKVSKLPSMYVGRLAQSKESFHLFRGGDPQQKGEEVFAASMAMLAGNTDPFTLKKETAEKDKRKALASWIVDISNPLPARVLANRIWHYHFGTGIVSTPSDFGFMGGRPSHPELLDWLASEILDPRHAIEDGTVSQVWKIKRLHKMMMMSKTYRQDSAYDTESAKIDANSRLLWRFPPRRLDSEEIRDSMLVIAGKLDMSMGGAGFRLYRYLRDNVSTYVPLDSFGPETYRRSVYHQNVRAARVDLMSEFDSPDCALPAPRRVTTTSPLQALTLMNHQFTMDMALSLAERISEEADGKSPRKQVDRAFQFVYLREPTSDERDACVKFTKEHGLNALCRTLLNTNEFVYLN